MLWAHSGQMNRNTKPKMITKIKATGLKSGDFTHTFDRINLIVGRSKSGKTSRLDAIRLGLCGGTILGRANELKTRTIDIMDLARNGEIEISVSDDQSRSNVRRWVRGKNVMDVAAGIPATPSILLDPSGYFSLSDAKKIEHVFSLYPMADASGDGVVAELRNIRLDANTEDTEKLLSEIIELATGTNKDRNVARESIQGWMEDLTKALKLRLSAAKANAERMTQTVQGITALGADGATRNVDKELAEARTVLQKLITAQAENKKALADLTALIERRGEIEKELAALKDDPNALAEVNQRISDLSADIGRIENTALVLPTDLTLDEPALRSELETVQRVNAGYVSKSRPARDHLASLVQQCAELESRIKIHDGDTRNLITRHEQAMAAGECAHCGAMPEHWTGTHSKASMEAAHIQTLAERSRAKSALTLELEQKDEHRNRVAKILAQCEADDEAHTASTIRANTIISTLHRIGVARETARSERDGVLKSKRAELEAAQQQRSDLQTVGTRRAAVQSRLAEVENQIKQFQTIAAYEPLLKLDEHVINDQKNEIVRLEQQRTAFIQAQADERRNAQAILEHRRAQANVSVTKAALDKMERQQSEMVATAFETILQTVNAVCAPIVGPIEYREGELGYWSGATWVRHHAFSNTEQGLIYVGLSLALAKDAPIKIVLLDELGRMDRATLEQFMQRVASLVSDGVIHQFVGCLSVVDIELPGINIINL